MSDRSPIEWTDATWNPTRGCSRVSPGCGGPGHAGGCYAEAVAARFSDPGQPYHGFAERGRAGSKWTGKVALIDDMLAAPLRWKKPRRIFVNSMSDLFHEALSDSDIDKVFAVMALCPQHTFQVLTKRAQRMRDYMTAHTGDWDVGHACGRVANIIEDMRRARGERIVVGPIKGEPGAQWWPLKNVWLGVSVEDQTRADERVPLLLKTPAAVRFLSCEPLLGPVKRLLWRRNDALGAEIPACVDWVIVGGESGPGARPMHPDWARSLRDQCAFADIPLFFKHWGEWSPGRQTPDLTDEEAARHLCQLLEFGGCSVGTFKIGKKRAGRLLDGREHNDFPRAAS